MMPILTECKPRLAGTGRRRWLGVRARAVAGLVAVTWLVCVSAAWLMIGIIGAILETGGIPS